MTTTTQRKKLSKSAWVLIVLVGVDLIGVIIANALGAIDLSWLGIGFLGIYFAVSQDLVLAVLVSFGWVTLGVLFCYAYYTYFRGNKTTTTPGTGYNPQPTTPSTPVQKDTETVIS